MSWTPPPPPSHGVPDVPGHEEITPDHPAWHRRHDPAVWGTLAAQGVHNPFHDAPLERRAGEWGNGVNQDRWEAASEPEKDRARAGMHRALSGAHLAVSVGTDPLIKLLSEGRLRSGYDMPEGEHWSYHSAPEYLDDRRNAEYAQFRYPSGRHPDHARPVYGYLTHHPFTEDSASAYGGHTLVLSRPALAHRTTWTTGDTMTEEDYVRATGLHRPGLHALHPNLLHSDEPDLGVHDMLVHPERRHNEYIEAQYHGGVGLHHVHYAIIRSPHPEIISHTGFVDRMSKHLDAAGIPWVHTVGFTGPEHATAWSDHHSRHLGARHGAVAR